MYGQQNIKFILVIFISHTTGWTPSSSFKFTAAYLKRHKKDVNTACGKKESLLMSTFYLVTYTGNDER
jgi:hypothetical protein